MLPLPCRCDVAPVAVPGVLGLVTCQACGVQRHVPPAVAPEPAPALEHELDPSTMTEKAGPGSPGPDWPGLPGHPDPGPAVPAPRPRQRGRAAGGGG